MSGIVGTAAASPRYGSVAPAARVLATRELRPGTELSSTSRFVDDVWVLTPAIHQRQHTARKLIFTTIPERFVAPVKELFYALLTEQLGPGYDRIKSIDSIYPHFCRVRAFLKWADEQGVTSLSVLTGADFEEYGRHVFRKHRSRDTRTVKLLGVRLFWLARAHLSGDRLAMDPKPFFPEQTGSGSKRHRVENGTDRIPEPVHSPLLTWALRWIDDFAEDVLSVLAEWTEQSEYSLARRRRRGQPRNWTAFEDLVAVLDRYRAAARPLPGRAGEVNQSQLAREARCSQSALKWPESRLLIAQAAAELGIADASYLWTPMTALLDGKPWLEPVGYHQVERLTRLLQTACYIVIAYLSGMRESEVKHLTRGCLRVWRDEDGNIVRYRVDSLAFKGEDDPTGVPASWIVTAPAARAIAVLERLQPSTQENLFAILPTSNKYLNAGTGKYSTVVKSTTQTNDDLAEFCTWINTYCAERGRNDGLPLVNGRMWALRTRQFRRTLAWFIARKPGGVIAGAIQYRHARVQMFEGYAGTSDSGFRAEVESEETIARGEKLADIVTDYAHHQLTGPAAAEAEARLAEFERTARFDGKIITDRKRLERYMSRHRPNVYPGVFVTCSDNPDRRLCERDTADGPSLGRCRPMECRNAAFTPDNRASWVERRSDLQTELAAGDVLAPLYRTRLETKLAETEEFLNSIAGPVGTEAGSA